MRAITPTLYVDGAVQDEAGDADGQEEGEGDGAGREDRRSKVVISLFLVLQSRSSGPDQRPVRRPWLSESDVFSQAKRVVSLSESL